MVVLCERVYTTVTSTSKSSKLCLILTILQCFLLFLNFVNSFILQFFDLYSDHLHWLISPPSPLLSQWLPLSPLLLFFHCLATFSLSITLSTSPFDPSTPVSAFAIFFFTPSAPLFPSSLLLPLPAPVLLLPPSMTMYPYPLQQQYFCIWFHFQL